MEKATLIVKEISTIKIKYDALLSDNRKNYWGKGLICENVNSFKKRVWSENPPKNNLRKFFPRGPKSCARKGQTTSEAGTYFLEILKYKSYGIMEVPTKVPESY